MEFVNGLKVPAWVVVSLSSIVSIYIFSTWPYSLFKSLKIPGPKPIPFFGNLLTLTKQGFHTVHQNWTRQYGKVVGFYEGRHPCMLVSETSMIREILVKDFNSFRNRRNIQIAGYPMDSGILQQRDDQWKNTRHILTPAFSSSKLKKMVGLIQDCGNILTNKSQELVKKGDDEIELYSHFSAYTMDVITSTAFGVKIDAYDKNDPFIKNAKAFTTLNFAGLLFMTYFLAPGLLPFLLALKITVVPKAPLDFFIQVIDGAIAAKKESLDPRFDLLQAMLNASEDSDPIEDDGLMSSLEVKSTNKKGLTNGEILAHSVTFFLAGHETTATTMTFLAYELALHPDIQNKATEEIDRVLGDKPCDYENIQELVYLDMCLSETLRLYPPATRLERTASVDVTLDDIKIPAETIVVIPVYTIHRDPSIYDNPDDFIPERFSPEKKAKLGAYHYMPFGLGPRICIGMRMAVLETKLGIARLLQKFKFSTCDKTMIPLKFRNSTLLQIDGDVVLKFIAR
ncbi:cytochrome P450 3A29 [Patella vulgata]|uniref:cytochrome P450 3A29 n=1 Tax=Patella vulgata TaxID=6465 RepID=UPI0024A99457|nr:cytochrome P450 3A29 [Patella vulgata]